MIRTNTLFIQKLAKPHISTADILIPRKSRKFHVPSSMEDAQRERRLNDLSTAKAKYLKRKGVKQITPSCVATPGSTAVEEVSTAVEEVSRVQEEARKMTRVKVSKHLSAKESSFMKCSGPLQWSKKFARKKHKVS